MSTHANILLNEAIAISKTEECISPFIEGSLQRLAKGFDKDIHDPVSSGTVAVYGSYQNNLLEDDLQFPVTESETNIMEWLSGMMSTEEAVQVFSEYKEQSSKGIHLGLRYLYYKIKAMTGDENKEANTLIEDFNLFESEITVPEAIARSIKDKDNVLDLLEDWIKILTEDSEKAVTSTAVLIDEYSKWVNSYNKLGGDIVKDGEVDIHALSKLTWSDNALGKSVKKLFDDLMVSFSRLTLPFDKVEISYISKAESVLRGDTSSVAREILSEMGDVNSLSSFHYDPKQLDVSGTTVEVDMGIYHKWEDMGEVHYTPVKVTLASNKSKMKDIFNEVSKLFIKPMEQLKKDAEGGDYNAKVKVIVLSAHNEVISDMLIAQAAIENKTRIDIATIVAALRSLSTYNKSINDYINSFIATYE